MLAHYCNKLNKSTPQTVPDQANGPFPPFLIRCIERRMPSAFYDILLVSDVVLCTYLVCVNIFDVVSVILQDSGWFFMRTLDFVDVFNRRSIV